MHRADPESTSLRPLHARPPVIVLNLCCNQDHRFEGWFGSAKAFEEQLARGLVSCPVCSGTGIRRLPSAPYVQTRHAATSSAAEAAPAPAAAVVPAPAAPAAPTVATMMSLLRKMARGAEDVGERLPEEARRIHYGEAEARTIRGAASRDEIGELLEEGILVMPVLPPDDELH